MCKLQNASKIDLKIDLKTEGPRGDLESKNFGLNYNIETKNFQIFLIFKVKFLAPKSPRGPPDIRFEKSNISAFTGKKN